MFLLCKPNRIQIEAFLERMRAAPFSYEEVGATQGELPAGYAVDRYTVLLGRGAAVFERAVAAVKRWTMFETGWTHLCWPDTPLEEGRVVCTLARHLGFWSLNACRIIYVVEDGNEGSASARFGFAFGTLTDHAERGEERFTVERGADNSVWYTVTAFSRPAQPLSMLGFPITRALQKRFARDSRRAMQRATHEAGEMCL